MQNYLHFPEEQHIDTRSIIGHTPISVLRDITSAQSTAALTGNSSSTRKAPAIPKSNKASMGRTQGIYSMAKTTSHSTMRREA
jgi:hypothetical protein